MSEKIISLEIEIDDEIQEELGVDVISIVDHPAIEVDFHAFSDVQFIDPKAGESKDEFIQRCVSSRSPDNHTNPSGRWWARAVK